MLPVWSEPHSSARGKGRQVKIVFFTSLLSIFLAASSFLGGEKRAGWRWGSREAFGFLCLYIDGVIFFPSYWGNI